MIVGAGPTGLTLANLLGRYGATAALVERNATTVQQPRAVSIDDEAMRIMQAAGLAEAVQAEVASGYGSHYLSARGRCFAAVEPTSTEYGFEKRNAFHQPMLEATLRHGLTRFGAVTPLFEHNVIDVGQDGDRAWIQVTGPDGSSSRILCDYLVACDGGSSFIRKQLGIELVGLSYAERWLIIDIAGTRNRFRHTQVFCDPRRPGISLPGPGGTRRFELMIKAGEDEQALLQPSSVAALLAAYGEPDPIIKRVQPYTFHARVAERWREGRIFLAGDAAHLTPPFAGQGMNSGLRDAQNLAWKLAMVTKGELPAELLDTYVSERPDHARDLIQLAVWMGRVMAPRSWLHAKSMEWGFRLLGLFPAAKAYIAEMRYKPKHHFHAGFIRPDGRPKEISLVGRLLPQPLVERPDRSRVRLDEILGPGFALVAYDADPERVFGTLDLAAIEACGVNPVGLTPCGYNPSQGDLVCVRNTQQHGSALAPYQGWLLLVRPDRTVAAACRADQAGRLHEMLKDLLGERTPAATAIAA
ncbi:bifunctional 3-(3-hydroxy-phenyl)propionate/3-hydroxycinnamic acid hydroxylase [Phenylobacterium montanum]|uniref:bifunctional 3-(3-hydroxy-phenyl)propionate/3-hydroxycinnamic acid hydroxylase n=1 Tax=Phenylobacterium montanum TaxID=2823693 RepID=UPI0035E4062F